MEKRHTAILKAVNEKSAMTVAELTKLLGISESTVRRDLTTLHNLGKLIKVHGGATSLEIVYNNDEEDVIQKSKLNIDEKKKIACEAASLIKAGDFVYIDAGTTTGFIPDYIKTDKAVFVTNGITIAKKLAYLGYNVNVISGRIKQKTEAIVGSEAILNIQKFNFNLGFFGANGIDAFKGYSTPNIDEADIKSAAIDRCKNKYVLADSSKFNKVTAISFARIEEANIITSKVTDLRYRKVTLVTEVDK